MLNKFQEMTLQEHFTGEELVLLKAMDLQVGGDSFLRVCLKRSKEEEKEEYMEKIRQIPFEANLIIRMRSVLALQDNQVLEYDKLLSVLPDIDYLFDGIPACIKGSLVVHKHFLPEENFYTDIQNAFNAINKNSRFFIERIRAEFLDAFSLSWKDGFNTLLDAGDYAGYIYVIRCTHELRFH